MRIHKHRPFNAIRIIGLVLAGLLLAALFALLFGHFVRLLWNWLMPSIFGLGRITYWQAFGLVFLARLLFGSFSTHNHDSKSHRHQHCHDCDDWQIRGGWRNWDHYDDWWKAEGKSAFERYIGRRGEEPGPSGERE